MGHVIVRNLDGDLPGALRRCRLLGDRGFLRNCASGAFMENRFGGQGLDGAAPTSWWREGDPWRPCRGAVPSDLRDACAAWAVRDVHPDARLAWCARLATDSRPCSIAVGGIAPIDASARDTCGASSECWFGRGYAWAMIGWERSDVTEAGQRCHAGAPAAAMRDACARGVGFRRAASLPTRVDAAAATACDELFSGTARAACHDGALRRTEPIAYA